jgi:hypothetical protein
MIDIKSFIKAQKAMWIKRLLSPDRASWKALPMIYLNTLLGPDTPKCNMECTTKPKGFPGFYWQILDSWFKVKSLCETKLKNPIDIRRESLWLNKNIKLNKMELKWEEWQNKNINIIHDIVDEQGQFLTSNSLELKYGIKCDVMKYNALKNAIPSTWRIKIKTMRVPFETISFKENVHLVIGKVSKPITKISNKDIYQCFIKDIQQKPIIIEKWNKELNLNNTQWKNIFTISKYIKNTKIRNEDSVFSTEPNQRTVMVMMC